jgi:hypothetical protein
MSTYLVTVVEKFNKETQKWEELSLFRQTKDGFERVDTFECGRSWYPWEVVFGEDVTVSRGLPEDLSDTVAKRFLPEDGEETWFSTPTSNWFDYCELKQLVRTPEAMVVDWDNVKDEDTEETYPKVNGFLPIWEAVERVVDAYCYYYPKPGEVRVVCFVA